MEARSPRDVPAYLPAITRPLLPWSRAHVRRIARRYHVCRADLWDETVTALLRASVYYVPAAGPFAPYARTAIHRACWRYVCRKAEKQPLFLTLYQRLETDTGHELHGDRRDRRHGGDDGIDLELELAWHSSEDEVLAREAIALRLAALAPDVIPVQPDSAKPGRKRHARS